jgi:hypothetical protein
MKRYGPQFLLFVLVLAAAITLACGSPKAPPIICGSTASGANASGALEAISVCPAVVDAGSYPDEQVQFAAFATYGSPPSPVTPITPQVWGACYQNVPTSAVSITSKGLAQCQASGTYTIFASDMTNCNVVGPCGTGCFVTGTAQLTCP